MAGFERVARALAFFAGAVVLVTALVFAAVFVYRESTVEMALSQAKQFQIPQPSPRPARSDAASLLRLRPRPWSSPLHNRRFDDAVAGASAAWEKNDYDRAIALNTEALNIHPSADLVWLLLTRRGDCYLQKGEPEKALADYDEAARLGGLSSGVYVSRALALRLEGKKEEAMREFDSAIASNPNAAGVYSSRADIFAQDGDLERAVADYTKALDLNPKNVEDRLSYATLYLRLNRFQKAILESSIVLQIDRSSAHARVIRAKAYAKLRMNGPALADLDAAVQDKTGDKASELNTVAWCRATAPEDALRNGREAVAEATRACELDHWKRWSYIDTLAAACGEAADFDHAITYEEQALGMISTGSKDASAMKRCLELYKKHKPFHAEPWDNP